jgi:hypothetical protein
LHLKPQEDEMPSAKFGVCCVGSVALVETKNGFSSEEPEDLIARVLLTQALDDSRSIPHIKN